MSDRQSTIHPNVPAIIVVAATSLALLVSVAPLQAGEQPSAPLEISKVETPKADAPVDGSGVEKAGSETADRQPSGSEGSGGDQSTEAGQESEGQAVDVEILTARLKETDAIGVFTKLAIRDDIYDLVDEIDRYRKESKLEQKMSEIRASFDGLLLKIVALLEDDPTLSRDLYVSRESIWKSLLEVKA